MSIISAIGRYRFLTRYLVAREINAKYKGSVLGFVWSLLNPLLNLTVYSVVFSVFLRLNIPHFSLFLLSGLLPWTWFQQSIATSAASLIAQSSVIKKVSFPREVIPMSVVLANTVNFFLSLAVLLLLAAVMRYPVHWSWCLVPVVAVPLFFAVLGASLLVSVLTAYFRDIEHLLNVVLFAWLYMTPIMYEKTMVPLRLRWLITVNPMSSVVSQFQRVIYYGELPRWGLLSIELVAALGIFYLGLLGFRRTSSRLAEVL